AQPGGLARRVTAAEPLHKPDEALGLVGERARALEERDRAEPRGELLDPDGEVSLERESRIVEPPLEHALVAADHERGVSAVRDEREACPGKREVALVGLHRRL